MRIASFIARRLALLLAVAWTTSLAGPVFAGDIAGDLRARAAGLPPMRIKAEWRAYRTEADRDPLDSTIWRSAGLDKNSDYEIEICYPHFRLGVTDLARDQNEKSLHIKYSWVDEELTALTHFEGEPSTFLCLPDRRVASLRGRVLLTPLELECFDIKATIESLVRRAVTIASKEDGGIVSIEFENPELAGTLIRAKFDTARGWAPVFLEQFVPAAQGRREMSYSMTAREWRRVRETWIVSDAVIVNRNPNVLRDENVVSHYRVLDAAILAEPRPSNLKLTAPVANVNIVDYVRMQRRSIGADGHVEMSGAITPEEIEIERAARQAQSEQMNKLLAERQQRPAWGYAVVGIAVIGVVGVWVVRARIANRFTIRGARRAG